MKLDALYVAAEDLATSMMDDLTMTFAPVEHPRVREHFEPDAIRTCCGCFITAPHPRIEHRAVLVGYGCGAL